MQKWPENQIVLVRVNYDLPNLDSLDRIEDSLETIKKLLRSNNKIILVSHWGRPTGVDSKFSLKQLVPFLEKITGKEVLFLNQYDYFESECEKLKKTIEQAKYSIFLLENTRFSISEKDSGNFGMELAKKYASLGTYFIDEAFAVSHREEVTNFVLPQLMPNSKGISYTKELEYLYGFKTAHKSGKYVLMGGSKLETKLPIIRNLIPSVDKFFFGGLISFTFLRARMELGGSYIDTRNSYIESDFLDTAKELLKNNPGKIFLPIDFVFRNDNGSELALDIGEKTLKYFREEFVSGAKNIFWNGPFGMYEVEEYRKGTVGIAKILSDLNNVKVILGGGDIVSALHGIDISKFDFISMGGGATLEYLGK
jgi:phosphoglycerate kinase